MLKEMEVSTRELISFTIGDGSPDLSQALHDQLTEFQRKYPGIVVERRIDGVSALRSRWLVRLVSDVTHEALVNAARHGKPSRIELSATIVEAGLLLRIRDNGQGFDARQNIEHRAGAPGRYGIRIMAESAESVQGRLVVSSAPGRGTQVTLFVPQDTWQPAWEMAVAETKPEVE